MKTKSFTLTLFLLIGLGIIPFFPQAQIVERQLVHSVQADNITYVSCAVDGKGNIYSATSYNDSYTYEGQSITKLQPNSREEILFAVHDSAGDLLFYRRIAVTGGNFTSVGRIEFMAVDSLGYAYLSTQGTTGNGSLRIEDDTLAISNSGNMVIQIRPNGELKSVVRFPGIRNVAAHDSLMYMAFQDHTDGNKVKLQCFDSTFTTPRWTLQGNASILIGAIAFERTQMAVSPNGNLVALLASETSGAATFGGQSVPFQTTTGFDEIAIFIADRDGNLLGIRTLLDPVPHAVAIGNDSSVYFSFYTPGTVNFAGNTYSQVAGFSSNYGLIIKWDSLGNEIWGAQLLSQTTSSRVDGLATTQDGDLLIGATWGGKVQMGDSLLAQGPSQRSLTARLNGADGRLLWSKVPVSADNSLNGQRIAVIGEGRLVMAGRGSLGYQYDCLDPVTPPSGVNTTQFLLIINESILEKVNADFSLSQSGVTIDLNNQSAGATDYLWDFGDGITSTDFSPTHTYITNGTFTVTLIASNCLSSDTFTSVVMIASVGIEDQYQAKVKIIYDQSLDLLYVDMMENHGRWTLVDLQGRALSQGQFIAGKNELNMNLYPGGIYLFRTDAKGVPFVFRFVKY